MAKNARVVVPLLLFGLLAVDPLARESAPERDSIQAADLKRDVLVLASDEMNGRLVGTPGNRRAAEFIASRFEELGLRTVEPDSSYLSPIELVQTALLPDTVLTLRWPDTEETVELGDDFYPERFSATGRAQGPAVFTGFGISAPSLAHDDYADGDIDGKVVLTLDHEPEEFNAGSPFDGTLSSEHGRTLRKALEAQRRGAVAVLFVADVHNHSSVPTIRAAMGTTWPKTPRRVPRYRPAVWLDQLQIPAVRISPELADRIVRNTGETLKTLAERAEVPGGITPVDLPDVEIALSTSVEVQRLTEYNVLGLVRGNDPDLRNEWLILCAHLDHEGAIGARVFKGADDNASGVAGLLELAEAYALATRAGEPPRRSILFAAWNAEERGLLGAWSYVEKPANPLDRTVAVINMDMIGRNEEVPAHDDRRFRGLEPQFAASNQNAVNILGYSYSTDLRRASETANTEFGLELRFRYDDNSSNLLRRSDHWPFLFKGVPAIFVHTGLHPDYHTERDLPEKLNYDKMTRIVRLVYQLSWDLAQADSRPSLN